MSEEIQILKAIDKYLRGELSVTESDQLWAHFLKQPVYLDYLIIEVTLRSTTWKSESHLNASCNVDSNEEVR